MKRLALLCASGTLWLFLAAIPALADGGPHNLAVNSGTSSLAGDCASCHRAHTAQATDLLKATLPGLCTTCHNGAGATTDVENGVQYVPSFPLNEFSGANTGTSLGALRGGGFVNALIDSSNAARLVIGGSQLITVGGGATSYTLTFNGQTTGSIAAGATAAEVQTALVSLSNIGSSTVYTSSTAAANMSSTSTTNVKVTNPKDPVTGSSILNKYSISFENAMRLTPQPPITASDTTNVTVSDTSAGRTTAFVGVRSTPASTTSTHEGAGTAWGNGAIGTVGATGVDLDCAKCHNPHGNGQYRILQTLPGEDWVGEAGVANWTPSTNAVEVQDVANATNKVRNYTILPGDFADQVIAQTSWTPTSGDYFRKKYDPSGAANWTNYYLKTDPMNTGWTSVTIASGGSGSVAYPTNAAAVAAYNAALTSNAVKDPVTGATSITNIDNRGGLMTAWCVQCHTRYSGQKSQTGTTTVTGVPITSPSSLTAMTPTDPTFMFKHGTTGIGCTQCHVSHGSNAAMAGNSQVNWPGDPTTTHVNDSRLLKVDNRGTCNLCHEPTGTVILGTSRGTGTVPGSITPGP